MNRLILTLLLITLFSCNYIKKRAVKDDLINTYSIEIESLKLDIESKGIRYKMIISEYKVLLTEKAIYKRAVFVKEKYHQSTDDYKTKIDQLDSDIKEIKKQFFDTATYNDSINKQIEYHRKKLDSIKKNDFDFDTEMSNFKIIKKRVYDREIESRKNEEILNRLENDHEKRMIEIEKIKEEIHDLIKK